MSNPFNARYDADGAWRAEVDTGEGYWFSNALTFDAAGDADAYAHDLSCRWFLVRGWRVVSSTTPERQPVIACPHVSGGEVDPEGFTCDDCGAHIPNGSVITGERGNG